MREDAHWIRHPSQTALQSFTYTCLLHPLVANEIHASATLLRLPPATASSSANPGPGPGPVVDAWRATSTVVMDHEVLDDDLHVKLVYRWHPSLRQETLRDKLLMRCARPADTLRTLLDTYAHLVPWLDRLHPPHLLHHHHLPQGAANTVKPEEEVCVFDWRMDTLVFVPDAPAMATVGSWKRALRKKKQFDLEYLRELMLAADEWEWKPLEAWLLCVLRTRDIAGGYVTRALVEQVVDQFLHAQRSLPRQGWMSLVSADTLAQYRLHCLDALRPYVGLTVAVAVAHTLAHTHTWDRYSLSLLYLCWVGGWVRADALHLQHTPLHKWTAWLFRHIHPDPARREEAAVSPCPFLEQWRTGRGDWSWIERADHNQWQQWMRDVL